jgi:hypothetical protein
MYIGEKNKRGIVSLANAIILMFLADVADFPNPSPRGG